MSENGAKRCLGALIELLVTPTPETQDEPRLDAQCKALVLVGCLDKIFFHGRPVLVGVEPASMVWFLGKKVSVLRGSIWAEQLQA